MSGPSSRMLSLLSLLQVHRDWPGQELAGRLDVSARTLRRDVDRLRELGYRIEALRGPAGGYRLAPGAELPPLLFDDDQAVAVALALAVAPASGADIAESAARALATVRQVMPSRLRHRIDAVEVVTAPGRERVDPDVLVAVSDAVRTRQVLRFTYEGAGAGVGASAGTDPADDPRPPLRVEPHAVVARNGRWYLLAWVPDRDDWRTYRIDRMAPRTPTRLAFTPRSVPGGDAAAFVEARFRGSDTGWPCTGTAELAVATSAIAPYLAPDDVLEDLGPDRCRLTRGAWTWTALAARFAELDADFRVVGPPELVDAARAVAARLSAAASPTR